jgi:hypothetical protein
MKPFQPLPRATSTFVVSINFGIAFALATSSRCIETSLSAHAAIGIAAHSQQSESRWATYSKRILLMSDSLNSSTGQPSRGGTEILLSLLSCRSRSSEQVPLPFQLSVNTRRIVRHHRFHLGDDCMWAFSSVVLKAANVVAAVEMVEAAHFTHESAMGN